MSNTEREQQEIWDSLADTLGELSNAITSFRNKIIEPYIERIKTGSEYADKYKDDDFIAYLKKNGAITAFAHKDNTEEDREWLYDMYLEGQDIRGQF